MSPTYHLLREPKNNLAPFEVKGRSKCLEKFREPSRLGKGVAFSRVPGGSCWMRLDGNNKRHFMGSAGKIKLLRSQGLK